MRIEAYQNEPERTILIAFIVSGPFLAKVCPKWPLTKSLFRSEWSDIIGNWCVEHYREFGSAPGKKIVTLFHAWSEKAQNEDQKKMINRLLASLSRQYDSLAKEVDVPYTLKIAEKYFNKVRVEKHAENLRMCLDRGHDEKAIESAEYLPRLRFDDDDYIDLLRNKEAQRAALEQKQKVLIKYKGGLGDFWEDELCEESLIAYVAPVKVGKSYYMLNDAWQGLRQNQTVGYFQIGDLSRNQIIRRFHARAAYRPIKARVVQYPISMMPPAERMCRIDCEAKVYDKDLTWEIGEKAFEKYAKKNDKELFRLCCKPTLSVSIEWIRNKLLEWDREGFNARIVVIDYSENLAPVNPKLGTLENTEQSWAIMSRIREERKCCLITALQAPKEAFGKWVHTRRHFSKNKMIFAHATDVVGINRTDEEAQKQCCRLNFVARREDKFSENKCVFLAECRDLAHVSVLSQF